jgi:hypothetical protein
VCVPSERRAWREGLGCVLTPAAGTQQAAGTWGSAAGGTEQRRTQAQHGHCTCNSQLRLWTRRLQAARCPQRRCALVKRALVKRAAAAAARKGKRALAAPSDQSAASSCITFDVQSRQNRQINGKVCWPRPQEPRTGALSGHQVGDGVSKLCDASRKPGRHRRGWFAGSCPACRENVSLLCLIAW